MSPWTEVRLVTWRELGKSFRSVKGLVLAGLTLTGGGVAAMLLAWINRETRTALSPELGARATQELVLSRMYGATTAASLADAPPGLLGMLSATLWLSPMLVALIAFDAISGELQHRTVRFWATRVRRTSYVLSKFLAAWLVVLTITLGLNVIVWVATSQIGAVAPAAVVRWGLRFFAVSVPITAAWCGGGTLVGSQFRTPRVALVAVFATFFGMWTLYVAGGYSGQAWLAYAYPNAYDQFFLSPLPSEWATGVAGTMAMAAGSIASAALLFARRDL